jgi:hypothetical protein
MSLCALCWSRLEPEALPKESETCDFCGISLIEEERRSGEQLHLVFVSRSPLNPKFKVKSGLIVKAIYDSYKQPT